MEEDKKISEDIKDVKNVENTENIEEKKQETKEEIKLEIKEEAKVKKEIKVEPEQEAKPKESQNKEPKKTEPSKSSKKDLQKKENPSKVKIGILVILGILTIISGTYYYKLVIKYKDISPKVIYQRERKDREIVKENLMVYIPSEAGDSLVKEEVEVVVGDTEEERIKNIFETLKEKMAHDFKYTDEENKVVEIPFFKDEIQLLDVYFDGTDIYLNMNYHFRDNMKTISQEIFIIYSIVNTITEDSRYKRVKFLIGDKEVEQLNFYKLSDFYERNLQI